MDHHSYQCPRPSQAFKGPRRQAIGPGNHLHLHFHGTDPATVAATIRRQQKGQ
jgi:hypothetical protein